MGGPGPYRQWPTEQHLRWARTANLFGQHLMREWAGALDQVPASASEEAKTLARQTGRALLHGIMSILDGVPPLETEDGYRIEYVLSARIQQRQQAGDWATVETVELAPAGEGLRCGLGGWTEGDFDAGNEAFTPRQLDPQEASTLRQQSRAEWVQKKRQGIQRRSAAGPPCPYCGKPLRTASAKQCFHCGRTWRETPGQA